MAPILAAEGRPKPLAHDLQIGLRLPDGDALSEAADAEQGVPPARGLGGERERGEDLDLAAGSEDRIEIEGLGQHPDDRGRLVVEVEGATHDRRIAAEAALPEGVAQDRRPRSLPSALLGREVPAVEKGDAQGRKEVVGDPHAAQALRLPGAGHGQAAVVEEGKVGGERLEALTPFTPAVEGVDPRRAVGKAAAEDVLDPHQPVGLAEGQGLQEHRVREAEHRGASTDTEGESGDRHEGKARGLLELTKGELQVGQHGHLGLVLALRRPKPPAGCADLR